MFIIDLGSSSLQSRSTLHDLYGPMPHFTVSYNKASLVLCRIYLVIVVLASCLLVLAATAVLLQSENVCTVYVATCFCVNITWDRTHPFAPYLLEFNYIRVMTAYHINYHLAKNWEHVIR